MTQFCFDFADGDEGLLAEQLRQGTERGLALRAMAKQFGVSLNAAIAIARRAGIHYKHRRQSPSTIAKAIALVEDQDLSIREAAKIVGMSKTAVQRFVARSRQQAVDAAGPVRFEQASPAIAKRRGWRCPIHGPLTVSRCVACLAEESR